MRVDAAALIRILSARRPDARLFGPRESEAQVRVDQSRHYLNRESPDRTLVGLILEHFDQLEHWSAELIEPER